MTRQSKISDWIGVVFINLMLTLLTIGMQFLMYGLAPAAFSPDKTFSDASLKEEACRQATADFNKTLFVELIIGSILVLFVSRRIVRYKIINFNLAAVLFVIIYLTVGILTMKYFADNYIRLCVST